MSRSGLRIDRRDFLKAATAFGLVAPFTVRSQIIERARFSRDDVPLARNRLLETVNTERTTHGLSSLQLDEFACDIADQHAFDMLKGHFLSHWGSDGRKPYQRYSFAGGTDALQENVASAENTGSMTPFGVVEDLYDMHQTMLNEFAPIDGHRRTILFPHHTHVGFGVAAGEYSVRLDEIYIARYAQIDPIVRRAKPGSSLRFSGRLFNPKHEIHAIYIYHEPLPAAPSIEWLRTPRSYGMPETFTVLLPQLTNDYLYLDGTKGIVHIGSKGSFRTPITFSGEPGINTIVVWIRRDRYGAPFPATQVCIRCE